MQVGPEGNGRVDTNWITLESFEGPLAGACPVSDHQKEAKRRGRDLQSLH
jgi:hypothetical protein